MTIELYSDKTGKLVAHKDSLSPPEKIFFEENIQTGFVQFAGTSFDAVEAYNYSYVYSEFMENPLGTYSWKKVNNNVYIILQATVIPVSHS
jgi:hypothetical protein